MKASVLDAVTVDTAIAAGDTLPVTVPNQLSVDYNAPASEPTLRYVAPELGSR